MRQQLPAPCRQGGPIASRCPYFPEPGCRHRGPEKHFQGAPCNRHHPAHSSPQISTSFNKSLFLPRRSSKGPLMRHQLSRPNISVPHSRLDKVQQNSRPRPHPGLLGQQSSEPLGPPTQLLCFPMPLSALSFSFTARTLGRETAAALSSPSGCGWIGSGS